MPTPRPKRRTRKFLQFSLRTLLIFVLLVSIGMSWFAVKMEKARRQKEAVEAIRKMGGCVYYDYQFGEDRAFLATAEPPYPQWARALLGDDFFFDVDCVSPIFNGTFRDDEAIHLKALKNLNTLALSGTDITDAGLEHFEGLASLEHLYLGYSQVTDAGLEHLEGLTRLDVLYLEQTQVTPEGVKKLQEALPDCEIVY
jgi:hypothetical protein